MELSINVYYWHEIMGPLPIYSDGKLEIKEEDVFILLSSIEPYSITTESSILGPSYIGDDILMSYNRSISNPDAQDERLKLMGTDCWVIISCEMEFEIVLLSKIELIKMILDIEFDTIDEISQLDSNLGKKASYAIREVIFK
ncbi:MAG: hypothetical protein FK733_02720 [Asgard group archaeon]|nr:hypothetical protein [Asgard group archaeon]